jgi:ubiquinone/menaquinone biosynthesis C-methylase UbiE
VLRYGRNRIAHELLGSPSSLLDYGCGDATFAAAIAQSLGIRVHVCDIDSDAISHAGQVPALLPHLISDRDPRVPLTAGELDAVTCCDVLEHMDRDLRRRVLAEISRLLADDGELIVTTPHKGLLAFADPENFKFKAPRAHRLLFRLLRGREVYERRYDEAGYGNYSHGAERHQHFSLGELSTMLRDAGFEVEDVRYFGLIEPIAHIALWLSEGLARRTSLAKPLVRLCWRLYLWDVNIECGPLGAAIAVRARRAARTPEHLASASAA